MTLDNQPYALCRFGNRPLLALPEQLSWRQRLNSLRVWECQTNRRRLVRLLLTPCFAAKCPSLLFRKAPLAEILPDCACVAALFPKVMKASLDQGGWLCVTWPAMVTRQRVYLHVVDSNGFPLFFAKLAFGCPDSGRLANEFEALRHLATLGGLPFHIPRAISFSSEHMLSLLVFEHLRQQEWRPVGKHVADTLNHIQRTFRENRPLTTLTEVHNAAWWTDLSERGDVSPNAVMQLNRIGTNGIRTCCAHGDFGPGNVRQDGNGHVLVLDWENWYEQAPWLTDRLNCWIGCHHRLVLRNVNRGAQRLKEWQATHQHEDVDVLFALAYLASRDNLAAAALLSTLVEETR